MLYGDATRRHDHQTCFNTSCPGSTGRPSTRTSSPRRIIGQRRGPPVEPAPAQSLGASPGDLAECATSHVALCTRAWCGVAACLPFGQRRAGRTATATDEPTSSLVMPTFFLAPRTADRVSFQCDGAVLIIGVLRALRATRHYRRLRVIASRVLRDRIARDHRASPSSFCLVGRRPPTRPATWAGLLPQRDHLGAASSSIQHSQQHNDQRCKPCCTAPLPAQPGCQRSFAFVNSPLPVGFCSVFLGS